MTRALERLPKRIADKITPTDSCWLWNGGKRRGYGYVYIAGSRRTTAAHRAVYTLLVGPIPHGLQLDHLCRVRHCVNPDHLEPVTQQENLLRGHTITAKSAAAVACPAGHPYEGDNLYVDPKGERRCRTCHRERQAARRMADPEGYRAAHRAHVAASRERGYIRPSRRKA